MWMLVMFDLPVISAAQRAAANKFRLQLLDMGFAKAQLSVYMRFCSSYSQLETYCKRVEACMPEGGRVSIIQLTDKQYEKIINYQSRTKEVFKKTSFQYQLFD